MSKSSSQFAIRLSQAMERCGYPPRPSVLEREFNTRYWGKPMTMHGVRRWLKGETMPSNEKIMVLCEWLGEAPQDLGFGEGSNMKSAAVQPGNRWGESYGYQDRELMEAFQSLPVTQRRLVREVILTFARDAERERGKMADASHRSRPPNSSQQDD
jgi:hypothetical protein